MTAALTRVSGPDRSTILMSAAVPGLGQFKQGRWLAGSFYCISFITCFVCLFLFVIKIFSEAMKIPESIMNSTNEVPDVSLAGVGVSFALGILLYIVNMVDVFLAYRKSTSQWAEWKLRRKHGE